MSDRNSDGESRPDMDDEARSMMQGGGAGDSLSMIRDLIARQPEPEPAPAAPAAPGPAGAAAPARVAPRKDDRKDRWAALRDALNADDEDVDDEDAGEEAAPAAAAAAPEAELTPIERIRARGAGMDAAPVATSVAPAGSDDEDAPDFVPYDDSVFGGSGTHEAAESGFAAPPVLELPAEQPQVEFTHPRVWDNPADHEMSSRGKMLWRAAIFGPMVVVPVVLLLTSPFSPKDTLAHYVAAAGCTAAGYMGVDSAREGEPGYHGYLDENGNGVACEPTIQRRLEGKGSVAFVRVGDQ